MPDGNHPIARPDIDDRRREGLPEKELRAS
jgi:hypothetical protein